MSKNNGERKRSTVAMRAPWAEGTKNVGEVTGTLARSSRGNVCVQYGKTLDAEDNNVFITERSEVHKEYIRQSETTKRTVSDVSSCWTDLRI